MTRGVATLSVATRPKKGPFNYVNEPILALGDARPPGALHIPCSLSFSTSPVAFSVLGDSQSRVALRRRVAARRLGCRRENKKRAFASGADWLLHHGNDLYAGPSLVSAVEWAVACWARAIFFQHVQEPICVASENAFLFSRQQTRRLAATCQRRAALV